MDILVIGLFVFVVVWFVDRANKAMAASKGDNKAVVVKEIVKKCPPHKWFYQEIKDSEGVTHAWKIVCEHCGPYRSDDGPAKMDF